MEFYPLAKFEYIIVGLGNPGLEYDKTRHNAGFMAIDHIASKLGIQVKRSRFKSLCSECIIRDKKCLLLKPQTFMNLSGEAILQAMRFYKIPLERVVVIYDDISLEPGKLRIRRSGSAGGHNGIKSIISSCGGELFPRIKLGVGGNDDGDRDLADFVLSKLTAGDKELLDKTISNTLDIVEQIVDRNLDAAMNQYNGG